MKKAGYRFSSANSINIGRLLPQIVYYIYSYVDLYRRNEIKAGEKIDFVVPTGNFGNILAAYYAKQMGLPINKLICASNDNKVLFDFFETGVYDRNREFILTISPSMDILVSSNLERLIYHIAGNDSDKTVDLMKSLSDRGSYEITPEMKKNLEGFVGGYASDVDTKATISKIYTDSGYVIDTHTAVAAGVYEKQLSSDVDETIAVIVSTASPYKFAESVLEAVGSKDIPEDDYEQALLLRDISGVKIPKAIEEIHSAKVLHDTVCETDKMKAKVVEILKII